MPDKKKALFVQRNYKDTIFHDLFSDKENALSLYNALNHTDYQDPEGLEVVTLSDAIYIHQKNDVAILFQDQLELWEHQSTRNGNMPLRGLLYFAREIEGLLAARGSGAVWHEDREDSGSGPLRLL